MAKFYKNPDEEEDFDRKMIQKYSEYDRNLQRAHAFIKKIQSKNAATQLGVPHVRIRISEPCVIFSHQPPSTWPVGNSAFPVNLNRSRNEVLEEMKNAYSHYCDLGFSTFHRAFKNKWKEDPLVPFKDFINFKQKELF